MSSIPAYEKDFFQQGFGSDPPSSTDSNQGYQSNSHLNTFISSDPLLDTSPQVESVKTMPHHVDYRLINIQHPHHAHPTRGLSDTSIKSTHSQSNSTMTSSPTLLQSPFQPAQSDHPSYNGYYDPNTVITPLAYELGGTINDMMGGVFEPQSPFGGHGGHDQSVNQNQWGSTAYPTSYTPG